MIKFYLPILSLFISLSVCAANVNSSITGTKDTVTTDFRVADLIVSQKLLQYGAPGLLVVLDIDNTLLTSTVDLGGDIWYSWQRGELEIKPTENQKVKCLFNDAIGLLYELGTMQLTDENIPDYIHGWQKSGITLFALTSRDPRSRTATERELLNYKIDFSVTGLRRAGEPLAVYRDSVPREMSYMKGIMMTAGMNKGEMLKYILEKTGRSFRAIVFVDDSKKNVEAVKKSFSNVPEMDLTNIQYEKIVAERKKSNGGPVLTQDQVNKMANDWKELNMTLNKIFPGRVKRECVSIF